MITMRSSRAKVPSLDTARENSRCIAMRTVRSTSAQQSAHISIALFTGTTQRKPGTVPVTDHGSTLTAGSSTGRLSSSFLLFFLNGRKRRTQRSSDIVTLTVIDERNRSIDGAPIHGQFHCGLL